MRAILFDCDSTLSTIEGIDVLAEQAGVVDQVVPLTNAAMEGRLKLEEAYAARLDLIKPDASTIDAVGRQYIETRVEGAAEAIAALGALGWQVHVVSGGIRQAVLAIARFLGVPDERVHAVDLRFDANGHYAGFDPESPLARSGGKAEIVRRVGAGAERVVMVGDGITDLEAAEAGALVIGFGGVVRREIVASRASHFIDQADLREVVRLLATPEELARVESLLR
ncbi:MAG: HAD-IB family phosphatase [Methyloversatilis discipulorum]|uniref:HAD-IB family phosphatase n=1 Tax=Methyloversatilis discipulorum TaxID=1119528 RepID=UPI0026F25FB1|nr:HAD-IB family phosphatase [Methyloversatilis discipulorum]MBT9517186.1 HAD-IB family phosphatase [Methyloversatilis discipulorum]